MSRSLIIKPDAEQDLAEAFDWYQQRRAGLGNEFLRDVDAALHHIQRSPLAAAEAFKASA